MTDMTRARAMDIVESESLAKFAVFGVPKNRTDCVAIYESDRTWHVVNTDERAVEGARRSFDSEAEALELFVHRLRLSAKLENYRSLRDSPPTTGRTGDEGRASSSSR